MPLGDNKERWITAGDLGRLLEDDRFQDTDCLYLNKVGNLTIIRDGIYIGWLDIPFGEIDWFEDGVVDDWNRFVYRGAQG